jgi:hypothetical protein
VTASPLAALRDRRFPRGADRDALLRLLASPIGWPTAPGLRAAAQELGAREPAPLSPGRVPLVSCTPSAATGSRAALWVSSDANATHDSVRFIDEASSAYQLARRVALAGIPVLAPRILVERDHEPVARRVWRSGDGSDPALDGRSFGLAFAVVEVSRLLGVPARTDVITSAVIDPAGRLHRVEHLCEKIRVVLEAALGVTTLVVAAEQGDDAKLLAAKLGSEAGRRLEIVGVPSLAAALDRDLLFDRPLVDAWIERCQTREIRREAVRSVFDLAIRGVSLAISWEGVARAARELGARAESDDERIRADVAARIALRHQGDRRCRINWSDAWLESLRRPLRVRAMAHIVQSATDSCDENWEEDARRAASVLPDVRDETTEDLELIGALGRAHASWARDNVAWSLFERAVRGWFELGEEPRASYALSALLALAAVMPPNEQTDALCNELFVAFDGSPRVDGVSRSFVGEARARMLEARQRLREALGVLDRTQSADERPHLRGMRTRTRARIARSLGERDTLDDAYASLPESGMLAYQRSLFALDARLHASSDATDVVDALRADEHFGALVRRIEASAPGPTAVALQKRFPY